MVGDELLGDELSELAEADDADLQPPGGAGAGPPLALLPGRRRDSVAGGCCGLVGYGGGFVIRRPLRLVIKGVERTQRGLAHKTTT